MHQCVRCSNLYKDGAKELLKGCSCGGKFFFFIKNKDVEEAKNFTVNLKEEEKEQIEKDAFELIGQERKGKPVILDLESIRINKPGQYELSLVDIFHKKPLVYKLEEGKYIIDLSSTFDEE